MPPTCDMTSPTPNNASIILFIAAICSRCRRWRSCSRLRSISVISLVALATCSCADSSSAPPVSGPTKIGRPRGPMPADTTPVSVSAKTGRPNGPMPTGTTPISVSTRFGRSLSLSANVSTVSPANSASAASFVNASSLSSIRLNDSFSSLSDCRATSARIVSSSLTFLICFFNDSSLVRSSSARVAWLPVLSAALSDAAPSS